MSNLDLWNKLCKTPPEVLTPYPAKDGTQLTAVDPIYRARKMTEVFGPVGVGWGWDVVREWDLEVGGYRYMYAKVQVWYADSEGIMRYTGPQIGGAYSADPSESFKSAVTDGIGKCCSMLGLAADVYDGSHAAPEPKQPLDGKMAEAIKRALKRHEEGDKDAIEAACEAVRRSKHYTESEKRTIITALSTGVAG